MFDAHMHASRSPTWLKFSVLSAEIQADCSEIHIQNFFLLIWDSLKINS